MESRRGRRGSPAGRLRDLRALPMFAEMSEEALSGVDRNACEVEVRAGAFLVRQGSRGRQVLILRAGTAAVVADGIPISQLSAGELVGDLSMLAGGPAKAGVIALTPVHVLVLTAAEFAAVSVHPTFAAWVATARLGEGAARRPDTCSKPRRRTVPGWATSGRSAPRKSCTSSICEPDG